MSLAQTEGSLQCVVFAHIINNKRKRFDGLTQKFLDKNKKW